MCHLCFLVVCTVPEECDNIELTGCTQSVRAVAVHAFDDVRLLPAASRVMCFGSDSAQMHCLSTTQ